MWKKTGLFFGGLGHFSMFLPDLQNASRAAKSNNLREYRGKLLKSF